ncbi:MAG: glycosyltransferase [Hyphomicrobiales bacterium]
MPQRATERRQEEVIAPELVVSLSTAALLIPDHLHEESAWVEHIPFAFWLVEALKPDCLVELGTHHGSSYLAFCQGVQQLGLSTRSYAVDTWQGDEHTGFYGEQVLNELSQYHDPRYGHFSRLVRSTFDEAVKHFEDNSINLLHIDGLHTYDAVRHDYETWRPKLAPGAIVLFHDTNVRERNFGVFKLWGELAERHPHFEFLHGHGLGVLGVGSDFPPPLAALFNAGNERQATRTLRETFARLGARLSHLTQTATAHKQLSCQLQERDERTRELEEALAASRTREEHLLGEVTARGARVGELDTILADLSGELSARDARVSELDSALAALSGELSARDARIGESDTALAALSGELSAREARIGELEASIAKHRDREEHLSREVAARDARIADAERALGMEQALVQRWSAEAAARAADLKEIKRSSSWRLMRPLRTTGKRIHAIRRKSRKMMKRTWRALGRDSSSIEGAPESLAVAAIACGREKRKLKIVFISAEPDTPGHYYRIENVSNALAPAFFEKIIIRADELPRRLHEITGADVIWMWRTVWTDEIKAVLKSARKGGARIVYDVDDLMFLPELATVQIIDGIRSQGLTEQQVQEGYGLVKKVMLAADHCTAPTAPLVRRMRHLGMPATVMPNGFDRRTFASARAARIARRQSTDEGLVRIGYASGSRTHQRDLAVASPALANILKSHEHALLVLFERTIDLDEFPELQPFRNQIEWRHFVPITELPREYARFDINIVPLEVGNPFCEAKSELKFFEAALAGVPTIASPTGPFVECIKNEQTGFLANTQDDWQRYLSMLIADGDMRQWVVSNARNDVLWRFGAERRGMLVTRLVNTLLSPSPVAAELSRVSLEESCTRPERELDVPNFDVLCYWQKAAMSRVTVIIPLYNYEQFVVEALKSVKEQTVCDIDLVVVDDCSSDGSVEVARRWVEDNATRFNRVALLKNRANSKLSRTRNAGISFADTEFVLPLDADNLLLPECVERCVAALDESGAAIAYPTIEMFGEKSGLITNREWDPARLQFANYIDAMAMCRKACWLAVGGYASLDLGWEDWDLWCKFAEAGFWGVRVPEVTAKYRVHGQSMLNAITHIPENRERVAAELTIRHPWLDIVPAAVNAEPSPATVTAGAVSPGDPRPRSAALAILLDVLRCPETGEPLRIAGAELESTMSKRRWPLVDGRPVFTQDGLSVQRQSADHFSNVLPNEAVKIIEAAEGPVLNLSAGGTARWYPNVIEVEYSIFRNTDVVADAHRLPFKEELFSAVICLNAFEHYREPAGVLAEIKRILRPGGSLFLHTAFLQPLHEAPHHYFNCTKYGLAEWLRDFNVVKIGVSDNLNPAFAFSWLASDLEQALAKHVSPAAAAAFVKAPVKEFVTLWRDEARRHVPLWRAFFDLPPAVQEQFSAGWEAVACKPN